MKTFIKILEISVSVLPVVIETLKKIAENK